MATPDVVILGAARTPIGRFLGALSCTSAPDLGGVAIRAAVERAGVDPAEVDEVYMGNAVQAGVGQAPGRQAMLKAGLLVTTPATTLNRVCAAGLEAVMFAARAIRVGDAEVVVAGGMESMSLAPHLLRGSRTGLRFGNTELHDANLLDGLWCASEHHAMGNAAELIAQKYAISRSQQDELALASHRKAVAAGRSGYFSGEIAAVEVLTGRDWQAVTQDETPRPDTSLEALSKLRPAFLEGGTVTPGNSAPLSDGAAAVVVASAERARALGLTPMARVADYAAVATEPRWLFEAPPLAIRRVLDRTGQAIADFDLIEVNEAFAAQMLANGGELGWDWDRVNVHGGAIALGHPLGASGARIVVTLLHAMVQRNAHRGLAALCHGGGGAIAVAFERP